MPKCVQSVSMHIVGAGGAHSFDPVSKVLRWEVGKIQLHKPVATLSGSVSSSMLAVQYVVVIHTCALLHIIATECCMKILWLRNRL